MDRNDAAPDVACSAELGRGGEVREQLTEMMGLADTHLGSVRLKYQELRMIRTALEQLEAENERLRTALADAIRRPMGVVPDSALPFVAA